MWDVIIVGGGIAGLVAGIRAQERGKNVLIISEGIGSLMQSSGAVSYGSIETLKMRPHHPYALMKNEIIQAGWAYFQSICPGYSGQWGKEMRILTPLGSTREVSIAPLGLNTEALKSIKQVYLIVPQGLKDFFPDIAASNIQKEFPGCQVETQTLRIPEFEPWYAQKKAITGLEYASFWRSEQGKRRLLEGLDAIKTEQMSKRSQAVDQETAFLIPGLAAIFSSVQNLINEFPYPVLEMTGFPPGAHGRILYEHLVETFKTLGGEFLIGGKVSGAEMQEGICQQVLVEGKGKQSSFRAQTFVLATGGLLGGGLQVSADKKTVRESVFNLPVYVPSEWANSDFLGEQPYAYSGVVVNNSFQPVCYDKTNIFVVGRALAHWDPWSENCAGGVSISSGYYVGEKL